MLPEALAVTDERAVTVRVKVVVEAAIPAQENLPRRLQEGQSLWPV